jgi:hypothetical protein
MCAIVTLSIFITLTTYVIIFPSELRVNSAVPFALVSFGGTSSVPVIFAVNFFSPCAKAEVLVEVIKPTPELIVTSANAMATIPNTSNGFLIYILS